MQEWARERGTSQSCALGQQPDALDEVSIAASRLRETGRQGRNAALADLTVPEVRRLLEIALPLPESSRRQRFAWSLWRRAPCWRTHRSHYRHRFWPTCAGPNPFDTS